MTRRNAEKWLTAAIVVAGTLMMQACHAQPYTDYDTATGQPNGIGGMSGTYQRGTHGGSYLVQPNGLGGSNYSDSDGRHCLTQPNGVGGSTTNCNR